MVSYITDFLQTTPIYSPIMITILISVGFIVGFINTLAGMATALSYALFMAMGMPINIANGTTRFGVLAQFAVSSHMFKKSGILDVKLGVKVGIAVAIGSFIGAKYAALVDPSVMEITMGLMLPIMAFLLLYNQYSKKERKFNVPKEIKLNFLHILGFILVGVYGGFTHAGAGILIIFGSFYLLKLDMLHANGLKQLAVVMYTPVALLIFIYYNQINWPVALIYSIGNIAGGVIASKLAIKKGIGLINVSVAIAVIAMSIWLIYKQFI